MTHEQAERAARRLWAAHIAGTLTADEWATMARILAATGWYL